MPAYGSSEPRISCWKVAPVATIEHVEGQCLRRVVHKNKAGDRQSTTLFKRCAVGRASEQGSHLAPQAPARGRRTAARCACAAEIEIRLSAGSESYPSRPQQCTLRGGRGGGPPVYQKEKLGVGNELVKGLAISTFLVQDGWKEHGVKRFLHTTLYGELLSQ